MFNIHSISLEIHFRNTARSIVCQVVVANGCQVSKKKKKKKEPDFCSSWCNLIHHTSLLNRVISP